MLPFPPALATLLETGTANQSLVFDRRFDRYVRQGNSVKFEAVKGEKSGKQKFLDWFAGQYQNGEYDRFFTRRSATLESSRHVDRRLQSSLILGLGLPHPTETGFLFDRLTGSVHIPGSTVKGLLRSAAEMMAESALEQPPGIDSLIRLRGSIFGDQDAAGRLICYDAFPLSWARLAVDIMTPHYTSYYMDKKPPGDWENPVPVPFLTVKPGPHFRFWFDMKPSGAAQGDGVALSDLLGQTVTLLTIALDWLGVGAKKSSGYGVFPNDDVPHQGRNVTPGVTTAADKPWRGASLTVSLGGPGWLVAKKDDLTADAPISGLRSMIPDDIYEKRLRKSKPVTADVTVESIGNRFKIVKVDFPPA